MNCKVSMNLLRDYRNALNITGTQQAYLTGNKIQRLTLLRLQTKAHTWAQ